MTSFTGCDSIVTIDLFFGAPTEGFENYTGCQGDGYEVTVNSVVYNEANPTGVQTLSNSVNCDSTVVINLMFNADNTGSETYSGCFGDGYSVEVNGTTYDESNPTGTEILQNFGGCDSLVTINLIFSNSVNGFEDHDGCIGDGYSVSVNGNIYNETNPIGTETLTSIANCDSIVSINLIFNAALAGNENYQGCENDGYSVTVNGTIYDQNNRTGIETISSPTSCDSVVTINLIYGLASTGQETYTGCNGDGYAVLVNGTVYNEANPSGTEVLTNSVGCDSTVTIALDFGAGFMMQENNIGCQGDGYNVTVNGTLYDESNPTGIENMTSITGCDSTVTINLFFGAPTEGFENYTGCQGDGYEVTVNSVVYNEANPTGVQILNNSINCDSTVVINLVFNTNSTCLLYTSPSPRD